MSDVNTLDAVVNATVANPALTVQPEAPEPEEMEEEGQEEAPE